MKLSSLCKPVLQVLLLGSLCLSGTLVAADKPNFIVILADDLGFGDIGAYGSTMISTPHIDAMARNGARLDGFYASANVCTASRGGLVTGRYPIRLDLVEDVARPTNDIGIEDEEITIAEALKEQGYATGLFGKWHLGEEPERNPTLHGFDEYYGLLHSNDMAPVELYRGTQMIEFPVDQTTLTKRYTAEALDFIERNQDEPFLVYLPHSFPHVPLYTSPEFSGQSDAGLYGDVVEEIDWSVGEIVSKLRELGIEDNTLIMFTSDNGPWFEGSAGPYRERKGTAWEGGLRVPMIAQWPDGIKAGSVSNAQSMNIDIFPTLVELAGGELPKDREIDGKNLIDVLNGASESPHEVLYLFDRNRIVGVRSGQWKLVTETKYQTAVARFSHENSYYSPGLLFDLQRDPSETYSFARENPEVLARMLELLAEGEKSLSAFVPESMWSRPTGAEPGNR